MEAHGVREHPPAAVRGRFVRRALETAVTDVILPAFAAELLAAAIDRQPADPRHGRARDRVPAGAHPLRDPRPDGARRGAGRVAAGARRTGPRRARRAVRQSHLDRRRRAGRARPRRARVPGDHRTRRPAASQQRGRRTRAGRHAGGSTEGLGASEDSSAGEGSPPAGGNARRGARAGAQTAAEGQLEQLDEDVELQQVLEQAAGRSQRAAGRARGRGTGLPTGRMPDRGVDRPPAPDEIQHARRYATRLRQALTHGTRRIDKRHPAGRFDGRAYTRAQRSGHGTAGH